MTISIGSLPASGTQQVVGLSSQPRMVLFTGTNRTEFDSIVTSGYLGGFLGFACNDEFGSETVVNYCESSIAAGPGLCSNLSETCCYAQSSNGSFGANTLYEGVVTAFTADGFIITFPTGSGAHTVYWMALCGMDGSTAILYEDSCDGGALLTDITVEPSLLVTLGQWRNSCHTLPKSTSTLPWYSGGFADVAGGSGILGAEFIYQTWSKSSLTQRWTNGINQPGTNAILGGEHRPAPLGTAIGLGYLEATRLGTTLQLNGASGGYDWVVGVLSEACTRMECGKIVAEAEGSTQTFVLDELDTTPEGCVFINMESEPMVAFNQPGRWGFGFATPAFNYSWLIDASSGSFIQSENYAWISALSATAFSAGTTDFTPTSGQVGFITEENGGGGGVSGFGAIRTFCDITAPLLISFDPFHTFRPSGTQLTTRGGHITPGEGGPGRTVP